MVRPNQYPRGFFYLSEPRAQALTLLAAFFWGTSFIVVELGLENMDPFWFAQFRFFIASIGAMAVVFILKKRILSELLFSRGVWLMGLFNALGFLGQFIGQSMTTPTKTALLINVYLILVAILSVLILKERFSKKIFIAIGLSFLGVFLLTTNGDLTHLGGGEFIGDMFALSAGISWAFYIVINKYIVTRTRVDIIPLVACVMFATMVVMIPFTLIFGGITPDRGILNFNSIGYVLYLGLVCNVLTFVLWTYGLKYLSTIASSILLITEVLVAAILGMIILHDFLTVIGIVGGLIILIAIIIINYDSKNSKLKISTTKMKKIAR
jgi:drug/metabolite transporter (DMT)-like permease